MKATRTEASSLSPRQLASTEQQPLPVPDQRVSQLSHPRPLAHAPARTSKLTCRPSAALSQRRAPAQARVAPPSYAPGPCCASLDSVLVTVEECDGLLGELWGVEDGRDCGRGEARRRTRINLWRSVRVGPTARHFVHYFSASSHSVPLSFSACPQDPGTRLLVRWKRQSVTP